MYVFIDIVNYVVFFFFKQKTAYEMRTSDWSSDVCSSDLTAITLNAMHPDLLVVRHQDSGAVALLAQKVGCGVINGGDGSHEHPTQALLDALTIRRRKGSLEGLLVAICGDILHKIGRAHV